MVHNNNDNKETFLKLLLPQLNLEVETFPLNICLYKTPVILQSKVKLRQTSQNRVVFNVSKVGSKRISASFDTCTMYITK